MEFQDYYKVLGVSRDADKDTIKQAYRRQARKYHPDRNSDSGAEDQFKAVQEAWEVLQDPEKRKAYDQLGKNWKDGQQFRPPPGWQGFSSGQGGMGGASGFSDFFENLFGGGGAEDLFGGRGGFQGGHFGGGNFSSGRAAPAQEIATSITLEEAFHGTSRELSRPGMNNLKVKIPAGVADGTKMRVAGAGGGSDVLLKINISPHRHFQLEGRDISLDLPLSPWEAALGAKVQVPTLGGVIDMKIPPGSQSGQRLRLKGRGLPNGKGAGDQYLRLQIKNPPVTGEEDRERLQAWAEAAADFNPRHNLLP